MVKTYLRGQRDDTSVPLTAPKTESAICWMSSWILSIARLASISRHSTPDACASPNSTQSNRIVRILSRRAERLLLDFFQNVQACVRPGFHK